MSFISKIYEIQENQAKRMLLSHLRCMTERQLIDCGFSPSLLDEGVKAWPWREPEETASLFRFDAEPYREDALQGSKQGVESTAKRALFHQDAA